MQLTAIFQITDWQESTEQSFEVGGKLTTAKVNQTYSGDLVGESDVRYQMNYDSDGTATFVGFEYFTGTYNTQPCRLIIKHDGIFEMGVAKSKFMIISSEEHTALNELKGHFYSTEHGKANFIIS